jgi:hypothetical protein
VVETVSMLVPVPPEDRETLAVLNVAVGPLFDTEVARLTIPAKPLRLTRVIVDVADIPAGNVKLVGFADIEKSGGGGPMTPTPIVTKCASDPLVPFNVTTYEPGGVDVEVDTVRVDVPVPPDERVTLVELSVTVGPGGPTIASRFTAPANPFTLVKLTSEEADVPCVTLMLFGLALITKSGAVLVLKVAV